jgi:Flp pilus assembly protein protease CpaA
MTLMNDLRVPILVVFLATSLAAVTDVRRFRIANWLTVSLLASGLAFHAIASGWPGLGRSGAGAMFGFFALIFPWSARQMGAGDVKLMAGVGAWLGLPMTFEVLITAAILGGVYALIVTIGTGRFRETMGDVRGLLSGGRPESGDGVPQAMHRADRRRRLVPFAAMVVVGLFVTVVRL